MQREFGHFICVCAQVAMSTPWKTAFPLTKSGHENWGKRKKERTWTPRLLLLGNKAQTANRAWHQVEGFTKSFHLLKATPANKEKQSEAMHIDMQTARSNWWSIQNPDPQKKTQWKDQRYFPWPIRHEMHRPAFLDHIKAGTCPRYEIVSRTKQHPRTSLMSRKQATSEPTKRLRSNNLPWAFLLPKLLYSMLLPCFDLALLTANKLIWFYMESCLNLIYCCLSVIVTPL